MSSFFFRSMILLLVVDLNRSFASIYNDDDTNTEYEEEHNDTEYVTDTEHEVISLEKKTFRLDSFIDVAPYHAWSVTKFEKYIAIICRHYATYQNNSIDISHIRMYDDRHPFNLLFIIDDPKIKNINDMVWNKETQSLFIYSDSTGVWEIRWEDHLVRKLSCPSDDTPGFISLSNDGHVLVVGLEDKLLYVCSINGTLIRKISFVKFDEYIIHTAFGQYSYYFPYYDPRSNDLDGESEVHLNVSEVNDFNLELQSIQDVNITHNYNAMSTNIKRFTLFLTRRIPGKDEDFHLFNLTIERRSNTTKYSAAEYSATDERLLGEFLSNEGEKFLHFECNEDSAEKWCFAPSASDDPYAASQREQNGEGPYDPVLSKWLIVYYYDREKHQLIAASSNLYSDDQQIYIISLQ